MSKRSLGDRMKKYEKVTSDKLMPRMPTLIRIDGKAFHTYVKKMGFVFPFDNDLHQLMTETALGLSHNVQNAQLCYYQSDEISILLTDWATFQTDQWFGGNIQKIASVSASIATTEFIRGMVGLDYNLNHLPLFDSRVWQLPKEEVNNYFLWRQQDASRNSIQMLGRSHFSHNQMQGKSQKDIHDMLNKINVNWNNLETWKRRGTCIRLGEYDNQIPLFNEDKNYIEDLLI